MRKYNPAIPFLDVYTVKSVIEKDTCTPMSIAALHSKAKTWRQPRCPSVEEWIKMRYIYIMDYYSATKKNGIKPFRATWIDLESTIMSEARQTE